MNRGYLYGDGFFETIRVLNGEVPLAQTHVDRILDALSIYQMEPAFEVDEDLVRGIALSHQKDGIVRINFFRDGSGTYLPEQNSVAFDHSFRPFDEEFFLPSSLDLAADLLQAPMHKGTFAVYPEAKPNVRWMTVKSLSSIYYVLAAKYKQEQQVDYLFIQNAKGHLCEELISNILIQKGEDFFIPSLTSGGVNGATQRFLLRNYRSAITEKNIIMEDIENADAVYSCKGSTGVCRIS